MFAKVALFIGLAAICQAYPLGLGYGGAGYGGLGAGLGGLGAGYGSLGAGYGGLGYGGLGYGGLGYGGYGHAVSTQNIYKHDGPSHLVSGLGHGYGYGLGHGHYDEYAYPSYKFDYGVKDYHTGDNKQQWESRDGHVTKGGYQYGEPDRVVRREQLFVSGHGLHH